MPKMIRIALLVFLSLVGGLLAAATFAVTIGPDGGLKTLTLPAVAEIAFLLGGLAGLLLSPLMVWALKGRNLWLSVPSIYAVACLVIVILNALSVPFAELIAFGVTVVVLFFSGLFAKRNGQRLADEAD
jgi:phosphatidylserine synthase